MSDVVSKAFSTRLAEYDERIAHAERNIAEQRGMIADMLKKRLNISVPMISLRHSIMLLNEMKKVRASVLERYGYASPKRTDKPAHLVLVESPPPRGKKVENRARP